MFFDRLIIHRADGVVATSTSVRDTLIAEGCPLDRLYSATNGRDWDDAGPDRNRATQIRGSCQREFLLVAVGNLKLEKDYPTLIRAFAQLRAQQPARLVILGEAKKPKRRQRILDLARDLRVEQDVDLPGLVDNPFAYMARAGVFALSSAWEGLPGVLIEAMACGCPVVSTDSPGGSREVLAGGRYGAIVPVGDATALAKALEEALDTTPDREALRLRAEDFSVEAGVLKTLQTLGLAKESAA